MIARSVLRIPLAAFAAALACCLPTSPVSASAGSAVITQGVDAATLDPLKVEIRATAIVVAQMYDTMLVHDRDGKLQPSLAQAWRQVSPTVWEFTLHRGVTFWNGDPLTSSDVKFSVEKIKDPAYKSGQITSVNTIARVETPDPYTVRYVTDKPTRVIPGRPWDVRIVDAKYWQAHSDAYMADHPMGSGPYIFASWRKDDAVEMDANPKYWGGEPPIAHVTFHPISEASSRVAALRTGASDLITNVPFQYALQIAGGRSTRMTSARSSRVLYVAFNLAKPGPQNDKLVRQALNYAVDVPLIVKSVLGGRAYPVAGPVPPGFVGFDPTLQPYGHDIVKAKALLAKAGYPDGKGLEMTLYTSSGRYNGDKEVAQAVAGMLAQVGVTATVRPMEFTSYYAQIGARSLTPMYQFAWGANGTFDSDDTLTALLSSEGRFSTYSTPETDRLIAAGRYELNPAKRDRDYALALHKIQEDAPWIFLLQYEDLYATTKRLQWDARSDEMIYCVDMRLKE